MNLVCDGLHHFKLLQLMLLFWASCCYTHIEVICMKLHKPLLAKTVLEVIHDSDSQLACIFHVCLSLQSISFRDAFYRSIMVDQAGFRLEDLWCDMVHPNSLGHRLALADCNGTKFE